MQKLRQDDAGITVRSIGACSQEKPSRYYSWLPKQSGGTGDSRRERVEELGKMDVTTEKA